MQTEHKHENHLAKESSPYLLQHKNNPVDWYPWNAEALKKAKDEDKPIFLSIGYSACHWCHVMEHESFEDEAIAKMLNENFICIKVDREERPDIDQIYMNAVVAMRGQGGWPLNVFLTPDQEFFFGGTYWPPKSRMGMPGFDKVLTGTLDAFKNRRDAVVEQSKKITEFLNLSSDTDGDGKPDLPDHAALVMAARSLENGFDFQNGGFGDKPKFPHAMQLCFLLRLVRRWPALQAPPKSTLRSMVKLNLEKMAWGGIYDHLGGGFARYSVDERWLVPHFEKMLYDNSLLTVSYVDMFQSTGDKFYETVARETLDYILHDLTDETGAFYSTEDADSEGVEGKFYVWQKAELEATIGEEIAATFCDFYHVTEHGNFEEANILNQTESLESFAKKRKVDANELATKFQQAKDKLLKIRNQRVRPGLDDKVLVNWNALAITAMARAGAAFDEPRYTAAAQKAAAFVIEKTRRSDGRLLHTWRNGQAKLDAYLDDYAGMIVALVTLYQTDFDERWIDLAMELANQMVKHFVDEETGAFFFTADDHEQLIARVKDFQDNSVPSGNALAATGMQMLGRLLGQDQWLERSRKVIAAGSSMMRRAPMAAGQMLIAAENMLDKNYELVLIGPTKESVKKPLAELRRHFLPNVTVICRTEDDTQNRSALIDEVLSGKKTIDDQVTLYVCQNYTCNRPVTGEAEVIAAIKEVSERVDELPVSKRGK